MYAKEAPSLLDRYTLAKSFGFKGVECAFPYEFSKEDLIKVTNLRLWSFMLLTYLHCGQSMMSQRKTPRGLYSFRGGNSSQKTHQKL
jgi:hydroxypyruvate isomerase